jgi:integrase
VLFNYRDYLLTKYKNDTARTYYNRLVALLHNQNKIDFESKVEIDEAIDNLSAIIYKNHFSQSKNALLHFCEFIKYPLTSNQLSKITELENKTKKKYRKLKPVYFSEVDKKIKCLKNNKLRLSYKTMMKTGLRVFELSQITPQQAIIKNEKIIFNFIGKGGKEEEVNIIKSEDTIFFAELENIIKKTEFNKKVFYSFFYLQIKANEMGFTCHDLRRIFAHIEYKKSKSKNQVKEKLRHKNIKNTNIYLRSKIKL